MLWWRHEWRQWWTEHYWSKNYILVQKFRCQKYSNTFKNLEIHQVLRDDYWSLSIYSLKMAMTHGIPFSEYSKKLNWDYGIHKLFVTFHEKICSSLSFWTNWWVSVSIAWRYRGAPGLQWWCLDWVGWFYVHLSELRSPLQQCSLSHLFLPPPAFSTLQHWMGFV